jgi:hypothetical protein
VTRCCVVVPLKLVEAAPDSQVIAALRLLLAEAEAGRITGLAYVTLESGSGFSADVVGACRRSRLLSLGIAKALEEAVAESGR